jgi:cell fate regulator YaaT (PSP1 superfamily)
VAKRIVKIKARRVGQIFNYDASDLELKRGDRVLIETDKGLGIGTVVLEPQAAAEEEPKREKPLKKVLRRVNKDDLEREIRNTEREQEALHYCQERIRETGLTMKLIQVENFYDGSKMIFYFTAPDRVDFRELVHQLAQRFHTRIEMQQIGVRDEAKLLGGVGMCGRVLCCQEFLSEFQPVSVRLAKEQDLPLNPQKLSGPCGRLLCCLSYEKEVYQELGRGVPQVGERVQVSQGRAEVLARNIFDRLLKVRLENGEEAEVPIADVRPLSSGRRETPAPGDAAVEGFEEKRPERRKPDRKRQEDRRKEEKKPPEEKPGP